MIFKLMGTIILISTFYSYATEISCLKVAVIGGGLAGSVASLYLSESGVSVDLFEKEEELFLGASRIPDHMYTGFMYADKGEETVKNCFIDAIQFTRSFPKVVNCRPTIMGLSKYDSRTTDLFENASEINKQCYASLCNNDIKNKVFGDPDYFSRKCKLSDLEDEECPWLKGFYRITDINNIKEDVFYINEYGLDMRTMYGIVSQSIKERSLITTMLKTEVIEVSKFEDKMLVKYFYDRINNETKKYDFVIDASGRSIANFENSIGIESERFTDVKMAGLFYFDVSDIIDETPEIYILGGI